MEDTNSDDLADTADAVEIAGLNKNNYANNELDNPTRDDSKIPVVNEIPGVHEIPG